MKWRLEVAGSLLTQMRYPSLSYNLLTTHPAVSTKKIRFEVPKHTIFNKTHIYIPGSKSALKKWAALWIMFAITQYALQRMWAIMQHKIKNYHISSVLIYYLHPNIIDAKTTDITLHCFFCIFHVSMKMLYRNTPIWVIYVMHIPTCLNWMELYEKRLTTLGTLPDAFHDISVKLSHHLFMKFLWWHLNVLWW